MSILTNTLFCNYFPDEALEELLQLVVTAGNRGVYATKNATNERNWSFGQSVFFSTTVITTIGYGHVTPLSQYGKGFCIFYAVIGIPFTLILISALVQRLMVPVMAFLEFLDIKFGILSPRFNCFLRNIHCQLITQCF
jgi:potassium channel subfamily K member 1